jgi:putative membrane protein
MSESTNKSKAHIPLSNTDLAIERTILAHERSLMAWVRTATSMISFGFTICKFFQELNKNESQQARILSARTFGMIMIAFGLLSLVLAQIQHNRAMKKIKEDYPNTSWFVSSILSYSDLTFGVFLFFVSRFRQ